jgi:hypothetical protein
MKTKSILILITGLLVSTGFTLAQTPGTGRCGQPRGTCGNPCNGQGFMNKGKGGGNGGGARQGPRDGSGKGAGQQKRDRKRDGTGPGGQQGT